MYCASRRALQVRSLPVFRPLQAKGRSRSPGTTRWTAASPTSSMEGGRTGFLPACTRFPTETTRAPARLTKRATPLPRRTGRFTTSGYAPRTPTEVGHGVTVSDSVMPLAVAVPAAPSGVVTLTSGAGGGHDHGHGNTPPALTLWDDPRDPSITVYQEYTTSATWQDIPGTDATTTGVSRQNNEAASGQCQWRRAAGGAHNCTLADAGPTQGLAGRTRKRPSDADLGRPGKRRLH